MIFKNNNKIANIYRGTLKISNVYRGGILVYTGEKPITYDGLTFEALEPSTILYKPSTVSTAQYSYDTVNGNSANNVTLNLNTGDKVYFKGNITGVQSGSSYANFVMTGNIKASGSIMSMHNGNTEDISLKYKYEFLNLFRDCESLITPPELPATKLSEDCYRNLFNGCSNLTIAPVLPATELSINCYANMFFICSSLTTPPALPATTLTEGCYQGMFYHCTSLTTAPALPATTLAHTCYKHLFDGCTSLTKAPELKAETLVSNCYQNMFYGCSKLNYIKAMFTTAPDSSYTANWVSGVSSNGTFVMNKNATWISGYYKGIDGIPEKWTVETA